MELLHIYDLDSAKKSTINRLKFPGLAEFNRVIERAYDEGVDHATLSARFWRAVAFVALLAALLTVTAMCAHGQSIPNQAPFKTPQINTTLYVGQTGYPTIQSAVSYACSAGGGWRVSIPAGATPGDTPTAAAGCASVYIIDDRTAPSVNYAWSGSVYAATSTAVTAAAVNTAYGYTPLASGRSASGGVVQTEDYLSASRAPLANWMRHLHYGTGEAINIVLLGDSRTICYAALVGCLTGPVVPINRYAEQLRLQLQGLYGSHGTGMVPLFYSIGHAQREDVWTLTGGFSTSSILGPTQPGNSPGSSLVALSNGQVATFTSPIKWDTLNTYCATNASSGSLAVKIDGVASGTACGSTSTTATAAVFTSPSVSNGLHVATFTCSGNCYLYAAEGTSGSTGVSIHNLAVASASAEMFGTTPATQLAFSSLIPTGTQLVILQLGTNETGQGFTAAQFQTSMTNIVNYETALPSAPSVLAVVPGVDNLQTSQWPAVTAALISVAHTLHTDLLNVQDQWGTAWSAASGLWASDGVHENDRGQLVEYAMIVQKVLDSPPTYPQNQNFNSINVESRDATQPFAQASITSHGTGGGAFIPFAVDGLNGFTEGEWGAGAGLGLPGAFGIAGTVGGVTVAPFIVAQNGDICFDLPLVGGNTVVNCQGASASLKHSTHGFSFNGISSAALSPSKLVCTDGGDNLISCTLAPFSTTFTTTSATSETVTLTGMLPAGHCTGPGPLNATAATNLANTYISAKGTNSVTLAHAAVAGMILDIVCTNY